MMKTTLCAAALALISHPAAAGEGWRLIGQQGAFNFVVVEKSRSLDDRLYVRAAAQLCAQQQVCQVIFWIEGTDAAVRLPMTDAQVESQVAHWGVNLNTGWRSFLWSCRLFPGTPRDECL